MEQLSNKAGITLRSEKGHSLSHVEGDRNLIELKNVIDDVSNLQIMRYEYTKIPDRINDAVLGLKEELSAGITRAETSSQNALQNSKDALNTVNNNAATVNALQDQINNAALRFGNQPIAKRTALADAISYALNTQTNSSEARRGIIQIANWDEVQKGDNNEKAVVPSTMKRLLDDRFSGMGNASSYKVFSKVPGWEIDGVDVLTTAKQTREVRESLWAGINNLQPITRSGSLNDTYGNLPWWRVSDRPAWVDRSFEKDGFVNLVAPDGSMTRTGFGYHEILPAGKGPVWTISPNGVLDRGIVPWERVTNRPSIGPAASKDVLDSSNIDDIEWNGDKLVSSSTLRALKDKVVDIFKSLSHIATTGEIMDSTGTLAKYRGGTGRTDGNADFGYIDTDAIFINKGSEGGIRLNTAPGGGDKNKVYAGQDNGEDINRPANINIDTWYGFSIASTFNNKYTFIHDARTGNTRQRGDLLLGSGESNQIKHIKSQSGDLYLSIGVGDQLRIESGNRLAFMRSDDSISVKFDDGKMVIGSVPVERLTGIGNATTYNVSAAGFNTDDLVYSQELAKLGHVKTLKDNVDWKYGHFAGRTLFDTSNPYAIPWDGNSIPTSSSLRCVADVANSTHDRLEHLTRSNSKHYMEFGGASDELLTTAQFKNAFADLTGDNSINSIVMAIKSNGEWGDVQYQWVIPGRLLTPCNAGGRTGARGNLDGTWKCLGFCRGEFGSGSGWDQRTCIWQKVTN